MCGVPFHSVSGYIQKLIDIGHKVAIVEQLSDPGKKGIVERGVVQIITPGTIMDSSLNEKRNQIFDPLGARIWNKKNFPFKKLTFQKQPHIAFPPASIIKFF